MTTLLAVEDSADEDAQIAAAALKSAQRMRHRRVIKPPIKETRVVRTIKPKSEALPLPFQKPIEAPIAQHISPAPVSAPKDNGNTSSLSHLYEQFAELTIYNAVNGIVDPDKADYSATNELRMLKVKYDLFMYTWKNMTNELFNELMISVAQSSAGTVDHPALQWIMAMYMFPEVHFENACEARKNIEAQGHKVAQTPLVCIWCGVKRNGPNKNMIRMKVNPNEKGLAPMAAYMCARQNNLLALAYNMLHLPELLYSDSLYCTTRTMRIDTDNLTGTWEDDYISIVGARGKKKASMYRPSGETVYQYVTPIRKWPRKAKKGSADTPMVFVVAEWRAMLELGQQKLQELKTHNLTQHAIEIDYDRLREEQHEQQTEHEQA